MSKEHTLIVGGGFGGLRAAVELGRRQTGRVTLVSRSEYFTHYSMLTAIAMGNESLARAVSIKEIVSDYSNVEFIEDELLGLDADSRIATFSNRRLDYDNLILALGSTQSHFDIPGVKSNTYSINTTEGAIKFSRGLRRIAEDTSMSDHSWAVAGGGFAGVKLSALINDYIKTNYPESSQSVFLLERSSRLLPMAGRSASEAVVCRLESMGIEVVFSENILKCEKDKLITSTRTFNDCSVVWTAGVELNHFYESNGTLFRVSERGRVALDPYLQAAEGLYVIGDNADVVNAGSASAAIHMGTYVAKRIAKKAKGLPSPVYRPSKNTTIVSAGRDWSYVEKYGIFTTGRSAAHVRMAHDMKNSLAIMSKSQSDELWKNINK